MRIGVDAKCLQPPKAGVARYLEGVLGGLEALDDPALSLELVRPRRRRRTLPWVVWDLQRASGSGIDVLHCPFYYPPFAPRCPTTVAIHDVLPLEHPEWFPRRWPETLRMMIPAGARRAAAIVTFSKATAERIVELCRVPPVRVRVVPHGVDRRRFAPQTPDRAQAVLRALALERPFVLQLGAIEPRRGVDLALRAVASLRARIGDLELVLAGPQRTPVPALTTTPEWARRVEVVSDEDVPALLSAAEAVVAPSRGEGFDLPVLEALACGAPVVASDIDVHVEHFTGAAAFFPDGDAEALEAALMRVLADSEHARALRAAGPALASRFTWDASARSHLEVWREVAR
ncbi:MAG: glycosyltransferase family 4 protein [Acidobacteriota bacterium]